MKRLVSTLAAMLVFASPALAGPAAQELIDDARHEARGGSPDFAFMRYDAALRADPDEGQRREATFAVAEYHFRQRDLPEAREAFGRLAGDPKAGVYRVLALAHLAKIARAEGSEEAAGVWEERLKDTLASQKLVLVFEDQKTRKWTSPLGTRFRLRESVDRLEVLLDDDVFYSIALP